MNVNQVGRTSYYRKRKLDTLGRRDCEHPQKNTDTDRHLDTRWILNTYIKGYIVVPSINNTKPVTGEPQRHCQFSTLSFIRMRRVLTLPAAESLQSTRL